MSSCPTLAAIREQAQRVYGAELLAVTACVTTKSVSVELTRRRVIDFSGRSKTATRRLALETLRAMAIREAP